MSETNSFKTNLLTNKNNLIMTTILISAKTECENYSTAVKQAQIVIVSHFGTKHAVVDDEMPIVRIDNVEVSNVDVNTISDAIHACCDLIVIVNSESTQVKGKFIFLTKE